MGNEYNGHLMATARVPSGRTKTDSAETGLANMNELKQFRMDRRESQEKFWGRFGVTQSSGSRFETGLGIPPAVAILVKLYVNGKVSDGDLLG